MKSPEAVFNELGKLHDFYKEIARFRLKKTREFNKGVKADWRVPRR